MFPCVDFEAWDSRLGDSRIEDQEKREREGRGSSEEPADWCVTG